MDIEKQLAAWRDLAKAHRKEFNARRSVEWKVLFAALSVYIASAGAVFSPNYHFPSSVVALLVILFMYISIGCVTAIYLAYIHMANNKNKSVAENSEDNMVRILNGENPQCDVFRFDKHWVSWKTFQDASVGSKWGWIWQTLTLLCFALACSVIVFVH
jgi:hypothetical protein